MFTNHNEVQENGRDGFMTGDAVIKLIANALTSGEHVKDQLTVKNTIQMIKLSLTPLDEMQKLFWEKNDKFIENSNKFDETVKKSIGKAKDLYQKMNDSLIKLDKSINIDKLEKQVNLLERAVDAMQKLDELQKTGKLDKILNAIK